MPDLDPTLPDLPAAGEVTWRPPTPEDAQALADHTRRVHEAERLSFLPGTGFFEWLLVQPGMDLEDDLRVAVVDNAIVADCGTWLHVTDRGSRCILWAETSPGFEHLRPGMLNWTVSRARQRLTSVDSDAPRVMRAPAEEHRTQHRSDIEAAGFSEARVFAEMARSLTDLPDLPPLPPGIEVAPWRADLEEPTRLASNDSFADHWGSLPQTPEEFSSFVTGNPNFRGDLSFVALDGTEVIALSLCEVDDDDNAERDTNDLYIHRVGTRAEHRGKGMASHLIVRSMQAAASTGDLDRAALEVDEMSHTNATKVYERLGFETYARSMSYFREV